MDGTVCTWETILYSGDRSILSLNMTRLVISYFKILTFFLSNDRNEVEHEGLMSSETSLNAKILNTMSSTEDIPIR